MSIQVIINEGKFIRGICNRFLLRGIKSQRCLRNLHDYRSPSPRGQTAETRWTKPRSRFPFRFTPLTIHERDQQNNLRDSAAERQASGDTKSGRSLTRTELFNRDINCKLSHRERIPSVRSGYCYPVTYRAVCAAVPIASDLRLVSSKVAANRPTGRLLASVMQRRFIIIARGKK